MYSSNDIIAKKQLNCTHLIINVLVAKKTHQVSWKERIRFGSWWQWMLSSQLECRYTGIWKLSQNIPHPRRWELVLPYSWLKEEHDVLCLFLEMRFVLVLHLPWWFAVYIIECSYTIFTILYIWGTLLEWDLGLVPNSIIRSWAHQFGVRKTRKLKKSNELV